MASPTSQWLGDIRSLNSLSWASVSSLRTALATAARYAISLRSTISRTQQLTRQDAPTDSIVPYTFKSHADDFHELCKSLGCENVVVGAHDWCVANTQVNSHPAWPEY
jgi:hypothetical protein